MRVTLLSACLIWVLSRPLWASAGLSARIETKIAFIVSADLVVGDYRLTGDELAPFLSKYIASAQRRNIAVYSVPLLTDTRSLLGLTTCPYTLGGVFCVVLVDSSPGANGQVATLLHELAHVDSPRFKTAGEAEVFAETVAFLVLERLGYDNARAAMSYLYHINRETRFKVLTESEDRILKLADRLTKVGKA